MRGIFLSIALAAFAAFAEESKAIRCDFSSQPDGATVIIDGMTRGVTPLTLYDLAPGRRHVRFELANYDGVDEFMFLREGGAVSKNAVLRPIKGILLLVTSLLGATFLSTACRSARRLVSSRRLTRRTRTASSCRSPATSRATST